MVIDAGFATVVDDYKVAIAAGSVVAIETDLVVILCGDG